tara:strand:- start:9 stop:290 length:282 start_codon:yes stop_codon:yes gene_type:complete
MHAIKNQSNQVSNEILCFDALDIVNISEHYEILSKNTKVYISTNFDSTFDGDKIFVLLENGRLTAHKDLDVYQKLNQSTNLIGKVVSINTSLD